MSKEKYKHYQFAVTHPKDVDIPRILRENTGSSAVLVTCQNTLVAVKLDLLKNFKGSGLTILGDPVDINWGYNRCRVTAEEGGIGFDADNVGDGITGGSIWRFIDISNEDISDAMRDISDVRHHKSPTTVRVTPIE